MRATGSLVKKTGVESQGVIPFLKIANDVTISINRSGRRRGAAAVYLEYWHADIEDFMELRKNTGDERRRAHDLNTATWIPDLFMKRLSRGRLLDALLAFDVPDLHDLYGRKFEEATLSTSNWPKKARSRCLKSSAPPTCGRSTSPCSLKPATRGSPGRTLQTSARLRTTSASCTPQPLHRDHAQLFSNRNRRVQLGLAQHGAFVTNGKFDRDLVARVVPVAMRMLDNVIDVNFYPTEKTKRSNMRHRPVGLGCAGFKTRSTSSASTSTPTRQCALATSRMEVISLPRDPLLGTLGQRARHLRDLQRL
jgi:ribonucleoside-diphosphate reductase alpha chain